ncbi:MAG: hypothetical protein WCC14_14900 [Acidobacteriaceae bacterium]
MRFSVFAFFLLTAAAALGQTAPPANPAPLVQPGRQFKLSVVPQQFTFRMPQTLLAQNAPPTLDAAPAAAKPQQIPTQWPNAKFELIPTQWPNARVVLIGGARAKQGTPVPEAGATLSVLPVSAVPKK